jgi:hypothetical protein
MWLTGDGALKLGVLPQVHGYLEIRRKHVDK